MHSVNDISTLIFSSDTQWLPALLNNIIDGCVVWTAIRQQNTIVDFKATYFNKGALDYIYKSGDLNHSTFRTLFPDAAFENYVRVAETGAPLRQERQFIDRWYDVSHAKWGDGVVVLFRDITEQKRLSQELAAKSQLFEKVFQGSLSGTNILRAIRDETGAIVDFLILATNEVSRERAIKAYGYDAAGSTWLSVYPEGHTSDIFKAYIAVVETGQSYRHVHYYGNVNVNEWYEVSAVKLDDGLVASYNNVTDIRRANHQLQQSIDELQRSNDYLSRFAEQASNMLQEPLRKIYSFSELLLQYYKPELSTEAADMLQRMHVSSKRLETLVRELLSYARLTADRYKTEIVSLNSVFNVALEDLTELIQSKGATVKIGSLPAVSGFRLPLSQLIYHLLHNALKFNHPDRLPRINVYWESVPFEELPTSLQDTPQTHWGAIKFSDNGIGFDVEDKERIFELFSQLESKSTGDGLGLGLAIAQKVVHLHSGAIEVDSDPDQGTTFTVYLPMV